MGSSTGFDARRRCNGYLSTDEGTRSGTRSTPPGCHGWQRSDARERKRDAADRPMLLDRLGRILRAARIEPAARAQQRRERQPGRGGSAEAGACAWAGLYQRPFEFVSQLRERARPRRRAGLRPAARRRRPASSCCKIAATRRRTLLRTTAFPTGLATVMPTTAVRSACVRLGPIDGQGAGAHSAGHAGAGGKTPQRAAGWHSGASDAEAVTPLLAAAREHRAAVLGAHALEEAVDALAATVVRLKRPLHDRLNS